MKTKSLVLLLFLVSGTGLFTQASGNTNPAKLQQDSIAPEKKESRVNFHLRPSLGLTFSDSNTDGERSTNLQWLGTLNSEFDYMGK